MYNFKEVEDKAAEVWKHNEKDIKKSLDYDSKKKLFSFLEGPPTANAPPALHHVEMRVFKDLFCRFKYMQGHTVPRKGGWDCHGLPVEVQIEKKLKLNSKKDILNYGIAEFNQQCKESVFSYINDWNKFTEKLAYWIDLEKPYVTLENNYIESVWWSLKELHKKNLLYEGHKVVPLCPRCETPLSSHEVALGYKDVHDPSIFVKFKLKQHANRYFLVFTTTPWTLFSNVALALKEKADYVIVKDGNIEYILAENLVSKHFENAKIIEKFKGKNLVGLDYEPLFDNFKDTQNAFRVVAGDFVSVDDGTGIVHIAPAFGEDDYNVARANDLAFIQPVNTQGKFTGEVKQFEGKFVKSCDEEIIESLDAKNLLFKKEKLMHSYPHCWRCNTPLLYYAMKSWFIAVSKFKDKLLENNKKINWFPETIKEGRFGDWLNNVKDWALSRTKFWGTPLPIWRCNCGTDTVIGSVKELREKGINVPHDLDLHKPLMDTIKVKCDKCGKEATRVLDVIDCWYDSGAATFAQWHYPFENQEMFEKAFPYDFIAEAIDQTRGWFYTLHVLGTILFDNLAYKNVVCAGHLLDEKGEKMSKSKGNVLNPWEVFDKVGVDAVRLQMCSLDPGDSKRFGVNLIGEQITPFLNIIWNCSVVLNNLKNKEKTKLEIEDEWLISKVNTLIKESTSELENHRYNKFLALVQNFVNEDLSRGYIKFVRDRISDNDGNVGYTLNYVFNILIRLLAPMAPYLTEYFYQTLDVNKDSSLVHFSPWPSFDKSLVKKDLESSMDDVKVVIQGILFARDKEKMSVRWPLNKAIVYLHKDHKKVKDSINNLKDLILQQVNVKSLNVLVTEKTLDEELQGHVFNFGHIVLDLHMTKELEEEGFAREIMRRIQSLRKEAGLQKQDKIDLAVELDVDLKKWKDVISDRCGCHTLFFEPLKKEYEHKSEGEIKAKKFVIGLNVFN